MDITSRGMDVLIVFVISTSLITGIAEGTKIVIIVIDIIGVTTMVTGVTAAIGMMDMVRVAIIMEEVIVVTVTVHTRNIY